MPLSSPAARLLALVLAAVVWTIAGPAAAANPTLHISRVFVNSPGADTGSNTSINAEYVTITNSSSTTAYRLTGWTIRDRSGHRFTFPTFTLRARASVVVHTGRGRNTSTQLYWGSTYYIWNNSGDTAYLRTPAAALKDSCAWGSVASYVNC